MKTSRLLVAVCAIAAACGRTQSGPGEEPTPDRSAIVIRGSEMTGGLLDGLRTRVPTMMVRREGNVCPTIVFRGQRSAQQQGNPSVYVDGTLMTDTCILSQITAADVDFVEIYTSAAITKPGVQRNPFGAIFIYRVRK